MKNEPIEALYECQTILSNPRKSLSRKDLGMIQNKLNTYVRDWLHDQGFLSDVKEISINYNHDTKKNPPETDIHINVVYHGPENDSFPKKYNQKLVCDIIGGNYLSDYDKERFGEKIQFWSVSNNQKTGFFKDEEIKE